eukprot:1434594-Rhodomonas_salina.1
MPPGRATLLCGINFPSRQTRALDVLKSGGVGGRQAEVRAPQDAEKMHLHLLLRLQMMARCVTRPAHLQYMAVELWNVATQKYPSR